MSRHGDAEWGRKPQILYQSTEEKAVLEARNGLLLFDYTQKLFAAFDGDLRLSSDDLKECHRIAIGGIYDCAGNFRRDFVSIERSRYIPPKFLEAPRLVEDMCAYANAHSGPGDHAIHVAAYLLWRINWIHPFFGGNGRVSRAISYLALCVGLNVELPGTITVVEQLIDNRDEYYLALEDADRAATEDRVGVEKWEMLLIDLLERQSDSGVDPA